MTMQIPRDPLSITGAISRIVEVLSWQVVAQAMNVAKVTVYRWTSDDEPYLPNVEQAVRLDHLWCVHARQHGHAPEPILIPAMQRHLALLSGAPEPEQPLTGDVLAAETIDLATALGRFSAAVQLARQDGKICEADRRAIREALTGLMRECGDAERATRKRK